MPQRLILEAKPFELKPHTALRKVNTRFVIAGGNKRKKLHWGTGKRTPARFGENTAHPQIPLFLLLAEGFHFS